MGLGVSYLTFAMAANDAGLSPRFWNPAAGSTDTFSKQLSPVKTGAGHGIPASRQQNLTNSDAFSLMLQQVYVKCGIESIGKENVHLDGSDRKCQARNLDD